MKTIADSSTGKASYAPIALFAFNRPWHLDKTLKNLSNCAEAIKSNVTIFIDGPRNSKDRRKISDTLRTANMYDKSFKSLCIIESKYNQGCAGSILNGIDQILIDSKKIIVLEDDILVSSEFLRFMNQALDLYENNKSVYHINGFNYDIDTRSYANPQKSCHMLRQMFCWGWGTWKDRWESMRENPLANDPFYIIEKIPQEKRSDFNINSSIDLWSQVTDNAEGKINTWAIFWYAFIFKSNGLCLTPLSTLTYNIGFDGSGTHCGGTARKFFEPDMARDKISEYPEGEQAECEDEKVHKLIVKHLKRRKLLKIKSLPERTMTLLKKIAKFW